MAVDRHQYAIEGAVRPRHRSGDVKMVRVRVAGAAAIGLVGIAMVGCGHGSTTKVGGITSVRPLCVGLVEATGFCASPPLPDVSGLRVDDCVRVTYRAKNYPDDVRIIKIVKVAAAQHRADCPTAQVPVSPRGNGQASIRTSPV